MPEPWRAPAPAAPNPPSPPAARRRRAVTPDGTRALAEAQAATDQARDVRALMRQIADARRDAVLRANQGGASYATIAAALGISQGNVQQIVAAARTARTTAGGAR